MGNIYAKVLEGNSIIEFHVLIYALKINHLPVYNIYEFLIILTRYFSFKTIW